MSHDLYTLDVRYCFCLVAERSFEYIITIINGRLSRLGFEDLYTNTVCFTSLQLWSWEERLLSSCPGQGIDWDLLVCCIIYLFVYSAPELWDSPFCICQGHFPPKCVPTLLFSSFCAAALINRIKICDVLKLAWYITWETWITVGGYVLLLLLRSAQIKI